MEIFNNYYAKSISDWYALTKKYYDEMLLFPIWKKIHSRRPQISTILWPLPPSIRRFILSVNEFAPLPPKKNNLRKFHLPSFKSRSVSATIIPSVPRDRQRGGPLLLIPNFFFVVTYYLCRYQFCEDIQHLTVKI